MTVLVASGVGDGVATICSVGEAVSGFDISLGEGVATLSMDADVGALVTASVPIGEDGVASSGEAAGVDSAGVDTVSSLF